MMVTCRALAAQSTDLITFPETARDMATISDGFKYQCWVPGVARMYLLQLQCLTTGLPLSTGKNFQACCSRWCPKAACGSWTLTQDGMDLFMMPGSIEKTMLQQK